MDDAYAFLNWESGRQPGRFESMANKPPDRLALGAV